MANALVENFYLGTQIGQQLADRRRQRKLERTIGEAWIPPQPGIYDYDPAKGPIKPPMTPGRFDLEALPGILAEGGMGRNALSAAMSLSARDQDMKKILFEHQLKQKAKEDERRYWTSLMPGQGGNALGPSSFKMGSKGFEMEFDPLAQRKATREDEEFYQNHGYYPSRGAAPQAAPQALPQGRSMPRQRETSLPPKARKELEVKRQQAMQDEAIKQHESIVKNAPALDEQKEFVQQTLDYFLDYSKQKWGGTGPFATLGGTTALFSEDTQNLEAKFNQINLKNMVRTFAGMSKAIDSDAERRAWNATQPGTSRDDKVNASILVGTIAMTTKNQAEHEARRLYIEQSPNFTLEGYQSPIIGKARVMFNRNGEPQLVDKSSMKTARQQGLMNPDQYAKFLMDNVRSGKSKASTNRKYDETTGKWYIKTEEGWFEE